MKGVLLSHYILRTALSDTRPFIVIMLPLANATVMNIFGVTHYNNHKQYVFSLATGLAMILDSTTSLPNVSSPFAPQTQLSVLPTYQAMCGFPPVWMINVLPIVVDCCALAAVRLQLHLSGCAVCAQRSQSLCGLDASNHPPTECGLSVCTSLFSSSGTAFEDWLNSYAATLNTSNFTMFIRGWCLLEGGIFSRKCNKLTNQYIFQF